MLIPHGVSGAIKRRAGLQPFRELRRYGHIPLGGAVATSAGRLPYKAIIHVASVDLWWRSSPEIVQQSLQHAVQLAVSLELRSLAVPILGAGSGRLDRTAAEHRMLDTLAKLHTDLAVVVVRYKAGE